MSTNHKYYITVYYVYHMILGPQRIYFHIEH